MTNSVESKNDFVIVVQKITTDSTVEPKQSFSDTQSKECRSTTTLFAQSKESLRELISQSNGESPLTT